MTRSILLFTLIIATVASATLRTLSSQISKYEMTKTYGPIS